MHKSARSGVPIWGDGRATTGVYYEINPISSVYYVIRKSHGRIVVNLCPTRCILHDLIHYNSASLLSCQDRFILGANMSKGQAWRLAMM